ncbi:MAG: ATPase [Spirochaetales bacterium]|nr:ATPase [Spirochaetales bacterium]
MGLFTSKMRLLTAVVIEEKSENVARELLRIGLLDFVKISNIIDTDDFHLKQDLSVSTEVAELRRRLETLYQQAGIESPVREALIIEQMSDFNEAKYRKLIDKASSGIQELREKQKKLHQDSLKLEEIKNYLNRGGFGGRGGAVSDFLSIHRGKPGRGSFDDLLSHLTSIPHFGTAVPGTADFFIVTLKRDQALVSEYFTKYMWTENDEQIRNKQHDEVLLSDINERTVSIKTRIDEIKTEMSTVIIKQKDEFDTIWKNLRIHELYGRIRTNFEHTEKTSLFSGWLPADKSERLEKAVKKASDGQCVIEWSEPEQYSRQSVPVEIKHSVALAPFQMLVENYAVPEYGAIDPTIFVAVSYMIMFGLMFGDAGQGLVIMLIGFLGGKFMKKASGGIKNLLRLFIYCGAASVITGILFGSYFGYKIFPPLWFDYHGIVAGHGALGSGNITNVYDILRITIYFGITVIGLGLILNWINLLKKKDYFRLLLDKSGILGGWFYGCGVYTAFFFVGTEYKELPAPDLLTVFFGIPVLILLFKAPLHFILHERGKKSFDAFKIIDFIMEWIVEILEIFSGYLANTLSFMRVAGLGIAHVSLMVAFDTIAGMTGGGAAGILILIIGNILVIALEGLSAGIQALRLNYYEFFSRYFTGKGIAYNPVSLRNRKQEG